jgi:transcriptional antiterminator RfaH
MRNRHAAGPAGHTSQCAESLPRILYESESIMNQIAASCQPNWYVVQTKPRQEFRALEQLRNQDYTCFLPTLKVEKIRQKKLNVVIEPLFSRYLFIQLDTVASNWAALRSTRGVSKLLEFGSRMTTISDSVIEALLNEREPASAPLSSTGEKVAIKSGPFAGLEGVHQMPDGDARALVLIEIISQPQKQVFALDSLGKAA